MTKTIERASWKYGSLERIKKTNDTFKAQIWERRFSDESRSISSNSSSSGKIQIRQPPPQRKNHQTKNIPGVSNNIAIICCVSNKSQARQDCYCTAHQLSSRFEIRRISCILIVTRPRYTHTHTHTHTNLKRRPVHVSGLAHEPVRRKLNHGGFLEEAA